MQDIVIIPGSKGTPAPFVIEEIVSFLHKPEYPEDFSEDSDLIYDYGIH